MAIARLIRRNLARNRRRTALTVASVAVMMLLLASLLTVHRSLTATVDDPRARWVLGVRDRYAFLDGVLPSGYLGELRAIEGVEAAMSWSFVHVGVERGLRTMGIATQPEAMRQIFVPVIEQVDPDELAEFVDDRSAVLMGRELSQRYGWKRGDRVELRGGSVARDFTVRIAGFVDYPSLADNFLMHDEYFQSLRHGPSTVNLLFLRATTDVEPAEVRRRVTERFRGRSARIEVISLHDYLQALTSQVGDVARVVWVMSVAIGGAVLLLVGSSLALGVRERARDVAVLRTLGYEGRHVVALVVGEAVALAVTGSALGSGIAFGAFHFTGFSLRLGIQSYYSVELVAVLWSVAIGAGVGALAGIGPALRSSRLDVVDALRGGA